MPDSHPALDRGLALERTGGDAELLRELADLFLAEYPAQLAALSTAVERGDAREVDRSAHMLKGSVANFGAVAAVQALSALEEAVRTRDLGGCEPTLLELHCVMAALRIELSEMSRST